MNRASVAAFAARATAEIRKVFSVSVTWKGKSYCVACTGVKKTRDIEAGGFEPSPDATLRIPTAIYPDFSPALGDSIQIGTTPLMVTSITPLSNSGEIKLELAKA